MRILLAAALFFQLALPARASEGGRLWVFIISVLQWQDSASFVSFPKENRRDALLVQHFQEHKKVTPDHLVWLKDSEATLSVIRDRLAELLARSKPGDELFLYYAGHGDRELPGVTYFIPYDAVGASVSSTAWAVPEIVRMIEADFKGEKAMLAADCCFSGGLCHEAQASGKRVSYACLASAQSSSPSTGEWTFTESLLRGLTGSSRVDGNRDADIVFSELAGFIEGEMSFLEEQRSASATTNAFSPSSKISEVSVHEDVPLRVSVRWRDGDTYRGTVLGDCKTAQTKPGKAVHFAGYPAADDECMALSRVRPFSVPKQRFTTGSTVYIEWEKVWYASTLLAYELGLYHVHYQGFDAFWDEWVAPSRIRSY